MKKIIRDKSIPSADLRKFLYQKFGEFLNESDEDLEYLTKDKSENIFKLIFNRYSYLRQFIGACQRGIA